MATICNTLHHATTHCQLKTKCAKQQATHCSTLQHTATRYNTLQHAATQYRLETRCSKKTFGTLQHAPTHCNTLQHTATHCLLQIQGARARTTTAMPSCSSWKARRTPSTWYSCTHVIVLFWNTMKRGVNKGTHENIFSMERDCGKRQDNR